MAEREPPIKDAESEVGPPRDEESERNLERREVNPQETTEAASENPFMEVEEETPPPDFPIIF